MSEPSTDAAVAPARYWWFEDRPAGTIEGYVLILFGGVAAVWAIVVVGLGMAEPLVLGTVYALPWLAVVPFALALRLLWLGQGSVPLVPACLGLTFVIGGAVFDLAATLLHSPTLDREGNPVLRALLDSGHRLPVVYGFAVVGQTLFVGTVALLWLALLRHREQLRESIGSHTRFWPFLKAATGGARLTWRQWILPIRANEIPHPYHVFWICVVVVVAGAVDRWYVGLDWFGLVPGVGAVRWATLSLGIAAGLVLYFAWLRRRTYAPPTD